jgi:hypothetical protein
MCLRLRHTLRLVWVRWLWLQLLPVWTLRFLFAYPGSAGSAALPLLVVRVLSSSSDVAHVGRLVIYYGLARTSIVTCGLLRLVRFVYVLAAGSSLPVLAATCPTTVVCNYAALTFRCCA